LKPQKNWKVGRMVMKISSLARKARKGDVNAGNALRDILDLISTIKDHGYEVPVSKSESGEELEFEETTMFHADGAVTIHISKAGDTRGPQGEELGTIREHADGSTWQKRDDGWHEMGAGGDEKAPKVEGAKSSSAGAKQGSKPAERPSALYQQATATLQKLKALYDTTVDPKERQIISQQIALVRNRIAAVERDTYAGQETPDNVTKEREVSKSESLRGCYAALASRCAKHRDMKAAVSSITLNGTLIEKAELKALFSTENEEAADIIKGWLR